MSEQLREKCAVFGIYGQQENNAAQLVYKGLFALQHRGQEGSGITSTDGKTLFDHRGNGVVNRVYEKMDWERLPGTVAIGHNRYGTSSKGDSHLQPVLYANRKFSLAHNGNIPDTTKLEKFLDEHNQFNSRYNDTEMMHAAVAHYVDKGAPLEEALAKAQPLFTGVYSLVAMDKEKMIALRDPAGIRPLSLGKMDHNYLVSSETCALDMVGAQHLRDVHPGEMVIIDSSGLRSRQIAEGKQKLDAFEFVYFSRLDSVLLGQNLYEVRKRMGKHLALEDDPIDADIVISVPDSGTPAAIGYAQEAGLPHEVGLVNNLRGRTFITPGDKARQLSVREKFNPMPAVLRGKSVVVVDDSVVRGTTSQELESMLREEGKAREVHFRSSSPPVRYPDFYGIDTPSQQDLIAAQKSVEAMRQDIRADSLRFLSLEGMIEAIGIPKENLNLSCFTGEYPIDIGKRRSEVIFDLHVD